MYLVYAIKWSKRFEPEVYEACITSVDAQWVVNELLKDPQIKEAWYEYDYQEDDSAYLA